MSKAVLLLPGYFTRIYAVYLEWFLPLSFYAFDFRNKTTPLFALVYKEEHAYYSLYVMICR